MRNVAAVLIASALLIPAVQAANVHINKPRIVYLTMRATEIACNAPYRKGCTTMQTEFFCNCVQQGDNWGVEPRLVVTPAIYTTTPEILRHELQHISDVRVSLAEYAATLMLHTFASEQSCSAFVTEQKATFGATVRNVYRVTTLRRDGMQYAEHAGDH